MLRVLTLLLLAGILPLGAAAQDRVLEDQVFTGAVTRAILVRPEQFTAEGLNQRFESFLSEMGRRFPIARLEIYSGLGLDDPRGPNCKCTYDVTYDWWGVLYKKMGGGLPASAELLELNGTSAVRIRRPNGEIESRVLKGPDPYSVVIDGETLRLVHVAVENVPRTHDVESGARLSFYLVLQDRPTEALAQHALEELRRRTGARNIDVILRNDPWFILDMDFPVVTPYLWGLVPPSRAQYEGAAEARCTDSVDITYCGSSPK